MKKPDQLSGIFEDRHFNNYPFVQIPQEFFDERGSIQNIADGVLGDVAVIQSESKAIRANHFHKSDWHFTYMVAGSMIYEWSENLESQEKKSVVVNVGEMVYTPAGAPHKMTFQENSVFIAISALSRTQKNYEEDTNRLPSNYF